MSRAQKEPGVININKPMNMTSHDVIYRMRKITGIKKIGHAGTLDPLATGVLVVLVGRQNTKRQAEFMAGAKEYVAEVTFGRTSETYDAEGPFENSATPEELTKLTEDAVVAQLEQFIGTIQQRPPVYSAIKVGGEALYKKARRGELTNADIPAREVTIDDVQLVEFVAGSASALPTARIQINCQKGVYIRSLAHDLGQAVGTGAYMSGLVRTQVGDFTLEDAFTLEEYEEQFSPEQLLAL